jgi:hypothetical protein
VNLNSKDGNVKFHKKVKYLSISNWGKWTGNGRGLDTTCN